MVSEHDEARKAISEAQRAADRTGKMARYAGADITLIAWGVVWMLGYLGAQFIPTIVISVGKTGELAGMLISLWWSFLVIAGIASTWVAFRKYCPVVSAADRSIGIMWGLLYGFVYVFAFLLKPFIQIDASQQMEFYKHMSAIAAIIPMLAYTIMGAFYERYLLLTGLGVTALTLLGLVTMGDWFYLWMAFVGGGTLIAVGLFIGRKWRTA